MWWLWQAILIGFCVTLTESKDRKASLVVLPPLVLGYEDLYEDQPKPTNENTEIETSKNNENDENELETLDTEANDEHSGTGEANNLDIKKSDSRLKLRKKRTASEEDCNCRLNKGR